jgi:mono/diheme cytochrome c family protein
MHATGSARRRTTSAAFVLFVLAAGTALRVAAGTVAVEQARTDFMLNCMGCHRADGAGTPPGIPALRNRVGYYLQIAGGREYLTQVPGAANAPLSDARLAAVLNWIVAEYAGVSAPAAWTPFTAGELAQSRGNGPSDIDARRRQLWDDIARKFPAQDATY